MVKLGLAAGAVLLLVLVVALRRKRPTTRVSATAGEIEQLIRDHRYTDAARLAMKRELFDQALELFLRAQQPQSAAAVAAQIGDYRQAAELYERAGNLEKAIVFYDKAGLAPRADELRARTGAAPARPAVAGAPPQEALKRGRQLEGEYRAKVASSDGTDLARAELQRLARVAGEALLAEGDIRRAADVYRDAELDDEAIHLYVNVLGEPGQAAVILSRAGNHQRAAELYELAGEAERAAQAWVVVADASKRPSDYYARVEQLAPAVAVGWLEHQAASRRPDHDSAPLYYHLARALAATGDTARAHTMFRDLVASVGAYKDVEQRLSALAAGHAERAAPRASTPAPAATPASFAGLSAADLEQLAHQVAHAAAEQLRRQHDLGAVMGSSSQVVVRAARSEVAVAGLEQQPVHVELMFDDAVAAAKVGPSIDTLRRFVRGPCDLGNIEVYYRLGLAHIAAGEWDQALEAFDAVEEASPGYRDGWKRADEIRAWRQALGPRGTRLGVDASAGAGASPGRYELRGELGRGGMAVVYRGHDTLLDRQVALKFLSEDFSNQDEMREMFQREARAVAQLNHPNIVTIHDVGILEGRAFICMEYVDGKSIENLIGESPGLTIVEALRVGKQALDALAYAHGRDIIHRDIKPANMMRTAAGLVKLMDFGLAKQMSETKKTSYIAGTPAYMAPEHLRGEQVDVRADLFAIAVSLYEMLTGVLPYAGLDRAEPPVPLAERVPAIPPLLADAVMRGLHVDRNRRWASAAEFAVPLQQILDAVARHAGGGGTAPLPGAAVEPARAATELLGAAASPGGKAPRSGVATAVLDSSMQTKKL